MRHLLRAAAAVLCASLCACVSLPRFQAGAPVEVEKAALGHTYRQGGKLVDMSSLLAGLEQVDAARADARSARGWTTGGNVLGIAGGATLGWGIGTALGGDDSGWAIAGVGAGVTAIALAVAHTADGKTLRAVEAYNAAQAPAPASRAPAALLSPWLGQLRTAHDRCVAGGVTVRF